MPNYLSPNKLIFIHGSQAGGYFEFSILDFRPGFATLRVIGKNVSVFSNEAGSHRWQRIPPTEKKGRVQTSTITVAILKEPTPEEFILFDKDLEITTTKGAGNGGQNKNKVETCVVITHKPTGTTVRCEDSRSQWKNKESAKRILYAKLYQLKKDRDNRERGVQRNNQIGQQYEKRRTVRVQHGIVKDHLTGKVWSYDNYKNGNWD